MPAPTAPTGAGNITTVTASSAATLTGSKPANLADGDLLWAAMFFRNATAQATPDAGNTGWTLAASPSNRLGLVFAVKPVPSAAGAPASYKFDANASGRCGLAIGRIVGADLTRLIVVEGGAQTVLTPGPPASFLIGSITTPDADCLLLHLVEGDVASASAPAFTPDAAMAEVLDLPILSTASTGLGLAAEARPSAGATGSRVQTLTSPDATGGAGFAVAVAAAALPPQGVWTYERRVRIGA